MRVAFVSSDNNRTSGAFLSMANLAKQLNSMGVETLLIIPAKGPFTGPGDGVLLLEELGLKYVIIKSITWIIPCDLRVDLLFRIAKIWHNIINYYASKELVKVLKHNKVDLVHINTSYTYFAVKSAKKLDIPIVWHIREFLEEDQNVRIWSGEKGINYINNATAIIAISNSIKDKYYSFFGDKIRVIYNGIDDEKLYNSSREIMNEPPVRISYVGGISEEKGVFDIIKACELIHSKLPIRVDIVGRGLSFNEEKLKKLIEESSVDYINYLGFTSDVKSVYDRSDIILVTSKAEAFGRVTVEAMLSGTLVIGANSAGTKELINDRDTGLLYESENGKSLANAIVFATENIELSRKIAAKGRAFMKENMTAKINAKNILDLYRSILGNSETIDQV